MLKVLWETNQPLGVQVLIDLSHADQIRFASYLNSFGCSGYIFKNKIFFSKSLFQVMVQPQNRSHSMSVYLAALTFPDTIILCLGKFNSVLKFV